MEFADPGDEIAQIEAELERLAGVAERCRKIGMGAKAAIIVGCLWIGMLFGGAVVADGLKLMIAIILPLGGVVLYGSNDSTARQTADRIATLERQRTELISAINLRVVADAPPPLLN
jgi:hypothetical protein